MVAVASAVKPASFAPNLPSHRDPYYAGKWQKPKSPRYVDTISPGTGESLGKVVDGSVADDEDWDWHLRLALRHQIGFVPTPCVLFRQRPTGSFDELQWSRIAATFRATVVPSPRSRSSRTTCAPQPGPASTPSTVAAVATTLMPLSGTVTQPAMPSRMIG